VVGISIVLLFVMNAQNVGQVGPFVDEKKLAIWLQELAIRLSHAAVILVSNHEGKDRKLLIARAHYLDAVNTWTTKYFPKN